MLISHGGQIIEGKKKKKKLVAQGLVLPTKKYPEKLSEFLSDFFVC
jgi:hypothetical protein